jgi:hypothetical protein
MRRPAGWLIPALLALAPPCGAGPAVADVRITGLHDVVLASLTVVDDAAEAQNVCVWSGSGGYAVSADGPGSGSAFSLSGGTALPPLAFHVEWSQSAGQNSGAELRPGSHLAGLSSGATEPSCSSGPSSTASLIIRIRAADLRKATSGILYSGTLTLIIGAE